MISNKEETEKRLGKIAGFIFMYLIVTIGLYFILKLTHRFPIQWNIFYIFALTLSIFLLGTLLKLLLRS